jgi:hypothetical protein
MKSWPISRRIILGFTLTVLCMACLSALSIYSMQTVLGRMAATAQSEVPATQLLSSFEREILNARINFIYFVTIQKPGSLDKGWEHYHNVEKLQRDLAALVQQRGDLHDLQPAVLKLHTDIDVYSVALGLTLVMVQHGERQGLAYDNQIKDWAAKGATLVADTGALQTLCATRTAASTSSIVDTLKASTTRSIVLFLLGAVVCIVLASMTVITINGLLRESVAELVESANQVAAAAGQVSSSSQTLAQGASEQAATIEQTSAAALQIDAMARQTTDNSQTTAGIVAQSQSGFSQMNLSLADMTTAMDGISASGQKISKIVKVIDEIAFQTNILALNAAVEAARAGESGSGFAVVAEEVRNLAQRSAKAAHESAQLIEESIQQSNGGKARVDQFVLAIHSITAESVRIKVLVDQINHGSLEQARGIHQISTAIGKMEQVTQSTAAGAEQGAAAAEQLNAQTETMKQTIQQLRTMVEGATHTQFA